MASGWESEINDDQWIKIMISEYKILWLQVPMNDLIWMKNNECIQNTSQYGGSILFSVNSPFFDLVKQLFAIKMLQDKMDVVFRFKYLV